MRRFALLLPCLILGVALPWTSGCSSSSQGGSGDGGTSNAPPHAVGTIVLGEAHTSGAALSTPVVSATFLPDSTAQASSCTTQVSGCTVYTAPKCGTVGCGAGGKCTWDAACQPTCQPACTLTCGTGQECYFAAPNQPACRTKETFDAGAIVFVGTSTPITLFPPYAFEGTTGGAPFMAGASIQVQASGATGTGFDKFTASANATTPIQTSPSLTLIPKSTIFGLGTVPVGWVPGSDTVTISVSGAAATVTCPADDTSGHFDVPRAAITAAQGAAGGSALSLSVTRERDAWNKSATTHGTLTTATVQPVGWIELSTISTESASVQGCVDTTQTMCPDGCFDTSSDPLHCGSCSVICASGQSCVSGQCTAGTSTTCTSCQTQADQGTCASAYDACTVDASCTSYGSCAQGCGAGNTTCLGSCQSQYPTGYSAFSALQACVCNTACPTQCAAECAQ